MGSCMQRDGVQHLPSHSLPNTESCHTRSKNDSRYQVQCAATQLQLLQHKCALFQPPKTGGEVQASTSQQRRSGEFGMPSCECGATAALNLTIKVLRLSCGRCLLPVLLPSAIPLPLLGALGGRCCSAHQPLPEELSSWRVPACE